MDSETAFAVRVPGIQFHRPAEDVFGYLPRSGLFQRHREEIQIMRVIALERFAEQRLLVAERRIKRRAFNACGLGQVGV